MANETKNERLVISELHKLGYPVVDDDTDSTLIVERQSHDDPVIKRLLKTASKKLTGSKGDPDFIITNTADPDLVVVIECKASPTHHESDGAAVRAADYAVEGAKHYAKHLSKEFDVVAIASSGEYKKEWRVSTFLHRKGEQSAVELTDHKGRTFTKLVSWDKLRSAVDYDPSTEKVTTDDLLVLSKNIHNFIRNRLSESQKALFIAGTLIALNDDHYRAHIAGLSPEGGDPDPKKQWKRGVADALAAKYGSDQNGNPKGKGALIQEQLNTIINTNPSLCGEISGAVNGLPIRLATPVETVARVLADKVYGELQSNTAFDILGAFYGEFLSYSGGDQKLGIVLTPGHITELMCDLAGVNGNKSIVLDPCTGTGGFLIAAMKMMFDSTPESRHDYIKNNCLIGVEKQSDMYALASANMLLRGDGRSSLFNEDCFSPAVHSAIAARTDDRGKPTIPNVGLINPPYGGVDGKSELKFITNMLDQLDTEGIGVAIVPMSAATRMGNDRKDLLSRHTLKAVMTMPSDLFKGVDVQPVIMVFKAHVPHDSTQKSWFALWTDDGHAVVNKQGRKDTGRWATIKEKWLADYARATLVPDEPGKFVSRAVGVNDPWVAEAWVETDYSALTVEEFEKVVMNYADYLRDNGLKSDLVATWDKEDSVR